MNLEEYKITKELEKPVMSQTRKQLPQIMFSHSCSSFFSKENLVIDSSIINEKHSLCSMWHNLNLKETRQAPSYADRGKKSAHCNKELIWLYCGKTRSGSVQSLSRLQQRNYDTVIRSIKGWARVGKVGVGLGVATYVPVCPRLGITAVNTLTN